MKYKNFIPEQHPQIFTLLGEIIVQRPYNYRELKRLLIKYPKDENKLFSKSDLVKAFKYLKKINKIDNSATIPEILVQNPIRSMSGVNVVSVLSRPEFCPGECIFCPNDILMPKSYIRSEPSCRRALHCRFDPYNQVVTRMKALYATGHPLDKIELLILGGTWNSYPENYRVWFIKELFRGLNEFSGHLDDDENNDFNLEINEIQYPEQLSYNQILDSVDYRKIRNSFVIEDGIGDYQQLSHEQILNETSSHRCVGLVVETRPDYIDFSQVKHFRKLGITKVQIGVQTLDPLIRKSNKINISFEELSFSFKVLRLTGFKILAHLMFNLYKATPENDFTSYKELFHSPRYKPDELKIYPAVVVEDTELNNLYRQGLHKEYPPEQLLELLAKCFEITPWYCRLPRVIRDIPSTEIIAGNKINNLREQVEKKLRNEQKVYGDIRAREIRNQPVQSSVYSEIVYQTEVSDEIFMQYTTSEDKIIAFLRLSLADRANRIYSTMLKFFPELKNSAIIREVHVYGRSLKINQKLSDYPQHSGFGKALINQAILTARKNDFRKIAVISAVGTRDYYRKAGFYDGEYYQFIDIT